MKEKRTIIFSICLWDSICWEQIKDFTINQLFKLSGSRYNTQMFNYKHLHCMGVRYNFERDSIELKLFHEEFPATLEGGVSPYYNLDYARRLFPYLFVDTNPLLYRKFKEVV